MKVVRGRPKWIPTQGVIDLAENLAAKGLTKAQISEYLGISYDTLNERTKEYSDFSEAIKRGRSKAVCDVANALYMAAISGNVTAMIFWLKIHAGWRDMQANNDTKRKGALYTEERMKNGQDLLRKTLSDIFDN